MSVRRSLAASALVLAILLAGCGEMRGEGGTSETESEIAFREIRVDSLLQPWNRPDSVPTVAVLRLDSSNFPFERSTESGRDVSVERCDGPLLPFRLVYWDKPSRKGRIEVRLDSWLQVPGAKFLLRWAMSDSVRADSAKVWRGIPDSQRVASTSVLVDDFEHDGLRSPLSSASLWSAAAFDSATVTIFAIESAGRGRAGKALHYAYSATKGFVLAAIPIATGARGLRSLDSIVLWARGNGKVGVSFDRPTSGKAWTFRKLDSVWTRICIRTRDLDTANNLGGNIGWEAVRDEVDHLTFFPSGGGSELWLDDIRLHGIDRDDLR